MIIYAALMCQKCRLQFSNYTMLEWKVSHIHCTHSLRHLETESGLDALRRMADAETIVAIRRQQTADEDEDAELLDSLEPMRRQMADEDVFVWETRFVLRN